VKVLLAMSGGVDSSVAGALLIADGHEVVGVTMKLWGGDSDTGCCSVSDVDDARRVAQQLDIDHLVFNFGDDFDAHVVEPYVRDHALGVTPNPCVECNRHIKFDRLFRRAEQLGFDAVATGHHARVGRGDDRRYTLERGADHAKDQSYVVHMLDQADLARTLFPVGAIDKSEVRRLAGELGLRTAAKPDSQDVCFITSTGGRETFLGDRISFRPGRVVDTDGVAVATVEAVEMITIGQRRGIGLAGGGPKRYVVDVDVPAATVVVGGESDLLADELVVRDTTWTHAATAGEIASGTVLVQSSAHGSTHPARLGFGDGRSVQVRWDRPQRRIARGQSVVFYDTTDTRVLGGGVAA
jgi:tRNA-specific 2-thiouridylase